MRPSAVAVGSLEGEGQEEEGMGNGGELRRREVATVMDLEGRRQVLSLHRARRRGIWKGIDIYVERKEAGVDAK